MTQAALWPRWLCSPRVQTARLFLSIRDGTETLEVITGVVPHVRVGFAASAHYDASLAAVLHAGSPHGVFAVVAGLLLGQQPLVVAEMLAIRSTIIGSGIGEDVLNLILRLGG